MFIESTKIQQIPFRNRTRHFIPLAGPGLLPPLGGRTKILEDPPPPIPPGGGTMPPPNQDNRGHIITRQVGDSNIQSKHQGHHGHHHGGNFIKGQQDYISNWYPEDICYTFDPITKQECQPWQENRDCWCYDSKIVNSDGARGGGETEDNGWWKCGGAGVSNLTRPNTDCFPLPPNYKENYRMPPPAPPEDNGDWLYQNIGNCVSSTHDCYPGQYCNMNITPTECQATTLYAKPSGSVPAPSWKGCVYTADCNSLGDDYYCNTTSHFCDKLN